MLIRAGLRYGGLLMILLGPHLPAAADNATSTATDSLLGSPASAHNKAGTLDDSNEAEDVELTPEHRFLRELLAGSPPIVELHAELSFNRFPDAPLYEQRGVPVPAYVLIRGSIQPEGFFFQYPTSHPLGEWLATGENERDCWAVQEHFVGISPKEWATDDSVIYGANKLLQLLKAVLMLGVEDARYGTIEWESDSTRFQAILLRDPSRRLNGELELDKHGLPSKLRYQDSTRDGIRAEVAYTYEERGAVPPRMIVYNRAGGGDRPVRWTNLILRLELGRLPDGAEAFLPSRFVGENDRHIRFSMYSNSVRYLVTASGLIPNPGGAPPSDHLMMPDHARRWWMPALILMAAVAVSFAYARSRFGIFKLRKRNAKTPTHDPNRT
ncbi:MAG TPA: hypothetical protein PKC18_13135 [Lacipirellulaceae bacterium]|nr:hypothetical protein [Lacipirellulaceae bacterium]